MKIVKYNTTCVWILYFAEHVIPDAIQTNHKNKISNNNAIMIIQANLLKVAVVSLSKKMQAFIWTTWIHTTKIPCANFVC